MDAATLLMQCGGKKEIAGMVLDEFVTQTPDDVSAIVKAIEAGDTTAASKAAHRLKGTAGVIGAHELHKLCFDVELAGKNGDLAAAQAAFVPLEAEVKKCLDFVPTARASL